MTSVPERDHVPRERPYRSVGEQVWKQIFESTHLHTLQRRFEHGYDLGWGVFSLIGEERYNLTVGEEPQITMVRDQMRNLVVLMYGGVTPVSITA